MSFEDRKIPLEEVEDLKRLHGLPCGPPVLLVGEPLQALYRLSAIGRYVAKVSHASSNLYPEDPAAWSSLTCLQKPSDRGEGLLCGRGDWVSEDLSYLRRVSSTASGSRFVLTAAQGLQNIGNHSKVRPQVMEDLVELIGGPLERSLSLLAPRLKPFS